MAEIVVAGAGVAGLAAALVLGRRGHDVTLIERDPTPLPATADEAFDWDRRGAPQVRHSHAFLARLRNLLRDDYPDVLRALLDSGATELRFLDGLPDDFPDHSVRPGDEDLVALACRRTTFEWALRRVVVAMPAVTLRHGVSVTGATAAPDSTPTVTGFLVDSPDGAERIGGDFFVAAHGRRADVPGLLGPHGVEIPEEVADTGIVYFSKFYRRREGVDPPAQNRPVGGDLGYLKYGLFPGDNDTFSMTLACGSDDADLRTRLRSVDGFDIAASTIVDARPWLASETAVPVTDTYVMAKLLNRRREFLRDDGSPRVHGFAALGDAHTCTNPLYGRGCSLAFVHATLLCAAIEDDPDDLAAIARAFERATDAEIRPWYRAAVAQDTQEGDPADFMEEVVREGLLPAVRTDPVVLRAFLRSLNLLQSPEELLRDTEVIGRVMNVYQDRDQRPPEPKLGVERDELLALLGAG